MKTSTISLDSQPPLTACKSHPPAVLSSNPARSTPAPHPPHVAPVLPWTTTPLEVLVAVGRPSSLVVSLRIRPSILVVDCEASRAKTSYLQQQRLTVPRHLTPSNPLKPSRTIKAVTRMGISTRPRPIDMGGSRIRVRRIIHDHTAAIMVTIWVHQTHWMLKDLPLSNLLRPTLSRGLNLAVPRCRSQSRIRSMWISPTLAPSATFQDPVICRYPKRFLLPHPRLGILLPIPFIYATRITPSRPPAQTFQWLSLRPYLRRPPKSLRTTVVKVLSNLVTGHG